MKRSRIKQRGLSLVELMVAMALGLLGQATVTPPDPAFYARGGWLHLALHQVWPGQAHPSMPRPEPE